MKSIQFYVALGFALILLSVSLGAEAASSNSNVQDPAAQGIQMVEVDLARFVAQRALPFFYEGDWQYFDHLLYYDLEGRVVTFAIVFQRQRKDTNGVLESAKAPTGTTSPLETLQEAVMGMRDVSGFSSDLFTKTQALTRLTGEEMAPLADERAEEESKTQRGPYGMDGFATVVTGAREDMPLIIKCYEGLPLAFAKKAGALALAYDHDALSNWQVGQLIYLDRFTEAVEVVRTPGAGARFLANEGSIVVNLCTGGIERRSTLREQFHEALAQVPMRRAGADQGDAAQRNKRAWEISKQRLHDDLREGDQSSGSPKEASLAIVRSMAGTPNQSANADSPDGGVRGAAGPDLRPVAETVNLPPGWGGRPIVVYNLPAAGPGDIQSAPQVQAGAAVYVGFVVGNYGDGNAGAFDVQVWDETNNPPELVLEKRSVDGLQVGRSWIGWNYAWRFTTSGSHRLRIKVDPNHNVTETLETNNEWSDQVVYVQGSAAKKEITGVPAYINSQAVYDIPGYPDDKGICVATSSAAVLGYWDRTAFGNFIYSDIIANIVAPLRDTRPPNPNVRDLVLALGNYYYVDHASERTDGIAGDTVWRDSIRYVTNEVKGYEFDVQVYDIDSGQTNSQLYQRIRDEIDEGRPALWGVDSVQHQPYSGHAVPVIGYVDSVTDADDSAFVHINLGEDPPRSEYVYWGGGDLLDFASDCVITIRPGRKPAGGPPSIPEGAMVLTFDEATIGDAVYIPDGYGGLSWGDGFCVHKPPAGSNSGYVNGKISPDYIAYNGDGIPVEVSGGPFDFIGTYLTAAHQEHLNVTIEGYRSGARIYSQTVIANRQYPTWIWLGYEDVDRVTFTPTPLQGLGYQFVMDNMVIRRPPANAGRTTVLTFDEATTGDAVYIPGGYGGLSWGDGFCVHKPPAGSSSGYVNGKVSPDYVAYNGSGVPVEVRGGPFDLIGAHLTAAHQERLRIAIEGYRSGMRVYSQTVIVNHEYPTWIWLGYEGVDRVTFTPTPLQGPGYQFVMDNMVIKQPAGAPTRATTLRFDGIATNDSPWIRDGYGGLDWSDSFCAWNAPALTNDGYQTGRVSPDYVAYNGNGNPVEVSGSPFSCIGAHLTSAHQDRLNIAVEGYRSSTRVYSQTVIVNREYPTWIWLGYEDVDRVTFTPTPLQGPGYQFVMDNMVISRSSMGGIAVEYPSADVPTDIFDDMSVFSTLAIADTGRISDIDVRLDITHSWDGDLSVYLWPPSSFGLRRIRLFGNIGNTQNDFHNTVLDDEAPKPITQAWPPYTGSYRPVERLSALYGGSMAGTWKLEIADEVGGDQGMLNSWSLIIKQ